MSATCPKCGGATEAKGWQGYRYCQACRKPRRAYPDRPCCVACRRQMEPGPNGYFRCRPCVSYVHATKTPRAARMLGRPVCPVHGRAMQTDRKARSRYRCALCQRERRAAREADRERREAEAAQLLKEISARLPPHLSPDEREDARQALALDVLAGALSPEGLTPAVLRSYARRARGLVRDPFRFVSIHAPAGDRRTFGELLEG